jgi:hypothetical protein
MTTTEKTAERLLGALTAAAELFTVELGRELGLYRALRGARPTPPELAKAAGIDARYAREWLEQQAAAGLLTALPTAGDDPDERRFALSEEVAAVLLDETGPAYLGTAGQFALGLGLTFPAVTEAFRTGAGVSYADYGRHIRHGIAAFNRPMFTHQLTGEWLPAVPELDRRLRATPGARVLDLGCGLGHSSVALALAYPAITVRGVDLDETSVAEARRNAAAAGVADRVSFAVGDAAVPAGPPPAPRARPTRTGRCCARRRCSAGPARPASPGPKCSTSPTISGVSTGCGLTGGPAAGNTTAPGPPAALG